MFGLKAWLKRVGESFRVPPPPVVARRPPPPPDELAADGRALLADTNQTRADNGRGPLAYDARLAAAAWRIAHDNATRDQLSHDGNDGSSPAERIAAAGYPAARSGENGFTCDPWPGGPAYWGSAYHAVVGWANSTVGHRETLLGDWQAMGGAKAVAADGSIYWFACFGTARS